MNPVLPGDLSRAFTGLRLRTTPDEIAAFVSDESSLVGDPPLVVVSPRTVPEVQQAMRVATEHRLPVVPRGAGTGLSGGACAVSGSVLLDLSRMTTITELDPQARLAVVEAGVVNADVSTAAAQYGLMYAPDPSSWESSTIGGNIATNAGGLRCARYGATRASVLGLDVVLSDGRLLSTGGRTVKRSAGYDLTQLFIGSEGTLGVVVGATLRLLPLPPPQLTALATFPDVKSAALAAAALVATTSPTLVELMDELVVSALDQARGTGFGPSVGSVLVLQVDDAPAAQASISTAMAVGNAIDVAVTSDQGEAAELLNIRRATFAALQRLGPLLLEDVCVPVTHLAAMVSAVAEIGAAHGVRTCTVAHAADGNLHPVIVRDGHTRAEEAAADAIFRQAQALGGTVSGEHGIGRLKRHWLETELGEVALDIQRNIKQTLDPLGLLNPGAVIRASAASLPPGHRE
ncbi:FAD-binding oxidoreductase [Amycolatopsis minnesotensis]|uniref:FAD-linked oxidase C-terminal domain-containing protein n=1 Tax=Amycolatopsis minnesotensis TaxID=337894 RepID=A0ABP5C2A6_9PSEU